MSSLHSLESQRSQVFALWSAGWSGAKIAEHLFSIHLENNIKKTAIYGWIERFKDGQSTVDDQPRSGRPCTSGGETSCQRVMALLDSDARLTVRDLAPDLAPADFAIFPQMKKLLRGRVFQNRNELEALTRHVILHEMPRSVFTEAINGMRSRWQKCVQLNGDYVEKPQVELDD